MAWLQALFFRAHPELNVALNPTMDHSVVDLTTDFLTEPSAWCSRMVPEGGLIGTFANPASSNVRRVSPARAEIDRPEGNCARSGPVRANDANHNEDDTRRRESGSFRRRLMGARCLFTK